jgi:hypothetical protein
MVEERKAHHNVDAGWLMSIKNQNTKVRAFWSCVLRTSA